MPCGMAKNILNQEVNLKTPESPLDCKESKSVNLKGNQHWFPLRNQFKVELQKSLEELMLKLKLQYFGHLMRRANSLEKTLMLERLNTKGARVCRG